MQVRNNSTSQLLGEVQRDFTKAMMLRSAPSDGLPIAFRSIMLEIAHQTILSGDNDIFKTLRAESVVGGVLANYYIAGDRPLSGDIAAMSDEPFPLITPYRRASVDTSSKVEAVKSFKTKVSNSSLALRYMMVQLSKLGYEYLKNVKYFPQVYNNSNTKKIPVIKSHVPVDLFRTTVFRTQGMGSNMYPMNPSEIFYTMYELLTKGYDVPVSELTRFKGFDLGNDNLDIYMKPEALCSLFDIGACSFLVRQKYSVDITNGRIIFHSFPFDKSGIAFNAKLEGLLEKCINNIKTFQVVKNGISLHGMNNKALEIRCVFHTSDLNSIYSEIETEFRSLIYSSYYHFATEVDIDIQNEIEIGYQLSTKSVRETLMGCIQNFIEVTKKRYESEIQELELKIEVFRVYEKATRPYVAKIIKELLLESDSYRISELKRRTDEYHISNPEMYPEFTLDEIQNYIWVSRGNDIIASLNRRGHDYYRELIEQDLFKIENLKSKLKIESIIREAKDLFLELSRDTDYARKTSVFFVNGTDDILSREKLVELTTNFKSEIESKVLYYGMSSLMRMSGENFVGEYPPSYTLQGCEEYVYQANSLLHKIFQHQINRYKDGNYCIDNIKFVVPANSYILYLTNYSRFGIFDSRFRDSYEDALPLLADEYFIDVLRIPIKRNKPVLNGLNLLLVEEDKISKFSLEDAFDKFFYNTLETSFPIVKAFEIYREDSDLNFMYMYNSFTKHFVRVGDINWNELNPNLYKNYIPFIYSGNKKIYVDGIHVPIEVFSQITGVDLKRGDNVRYLKMPKSIGDYITYVAPEEKNPKVISSIKGLIDKVTESSGLPNYEGRQVLSACRFIREVVI